jgi:hypothetical protein
MLRSRDAIRSVSSPLGLADCVSDQRPHRLGRGEEGRGRKPSISEDTIAETVDLTPVVDRLGASPGITGAMIRTCGWSSASAEPE